MFSTAIEPAATGTSWDLTFAEGRLLSRVVEELYARGMVTPGDTDPACIAAWQCGPMTYRSFLLTDGRPSAAMMWGAWVNGREHLPSSRVLRRRLPQRGAVGAETMIGLIGDTSAECGCVAI